MKGRTVPIIVQPTRADDPSMAIDEAFFMRNRHLTEYTRDVIAGEFPEPLPPGTKVHVKRIGAQRVRGFAPPQEGLN